MSVPRLPKMDFATPAEMDEKMRADARRWRALVDREWTLWRFPTIEVENRWRVVHVITMGESHTIGRGKTAEEALANALERPEWSPQ